jgi:alanine dehydrogenase
MSRGIRVVGAAEVAASLSMAECIQAVEEAFASVARGEARQPPRTVIRLPDAPYPPDAPAPLPTEPIVGSSFLAMPAFLGSPRALGAKLLGLFPGNHGRGIPSHQGVVVLFDPDEGTPRLVVDAAPITAIRTAAASAVATRLLAREEASVLAIIGSGVQARSHVEGMLAVRPISRVRAWSPTRPNLAAFVEEMAAAHSVPVEAAESARAAVEGADIVCTVTSSPTPVVEGTWLGPGTHVNAVGASTAETRELDTAAVARSRFWVDHLESARLEAGEWLLARSEANLPDAHLLGDIGEVVLGRLPGREGPEEITLFKSLGLAVQDLAAVARMGA